MDDSQTAEQQGPISKDGRILIGISACLLGQEVRFDGGHKRDQFLTESLKPFVRFVPVCPEMEIGLGSPRESLRLIKVAGAARLIAPKSRTDHTDAMASFALRRSKELANQGILGFIFKKDSPSCGLFRVRIYDHNGIPSRDGQGFFAESMQSKYPLLPVEEEGRLHDPVLRENFFIRLFAALRIREFFATRWTLGSLVAFHSREKLLLLAHEPAAYQALGRLVAGAKQIPRAELSDQYQRRFLSALEKVAPVGRHLNVLQHMAGYISKNLDPRGRDELNDLFSDYHRRRVPLIVPITLLRHHLRVFNITYLTDQTYLNPHPKELALRNHV